MALTPGTRLGVYEITAHIGEGGMGQVYRARDTTLHRDVALKILPDAFATDKDRLARFTREAQTLAALNHPHIAHLHGLEDFAGLRALVMELVEGDDLSQRLTRGAIPVGDAIAIARQIAEALEAAHEQGIIHRDLKPANIKVRDDGTVKVLDFGLAKGVDAAGAAPMNVTQSPTITSPALTEAGVILGTAAYMSPEQAKGRAADRRSDVWAFGAVVYEMLTGQRPFKGEDVSETLAFILTREPDWTLLPADTPRVVERLLRRCLEKNPKRRLPAIAEARIQMDDLSSGAIAEGVQSRPLAAVSGWRSVLALASVGLLAVMAGAAGTWMAVRAPDPSLPVTRFSVPLPDSQVLATSINDRDVAVSADGATLAYAAGTQSQLMVHALDQLEAQPLAGVANARAPVFSPDGRWIAFFNQLDETPGAGPLREGTLTKVSIAGGAPITLCRVTGGSRGASWAPDNTIVFATNDDTTGLLRVSAAAGEPTPLTTPDQGKGERDHLHPSVLPGGRGVLFSILYSGSPSRVAVLDLDTGGYKTLVREGSQAVYVESGHLVYVAARSLWAVRFNLATLEVVGDPLPIAEQVMTPAAANFSVSLSGALVYVRDTAASRGERSLVWVSRRGEQTPIAAPPRIYNYPRLSPDSTRVALRINDPEPGLWSWDFGPARFTQLAPDGGLSLVWSRDGLSFFFSRQHQRAEWITSRRRSDGIGADEPLLSSREYHMPLAISPDGSRLVYHAIPKPEADYDLMVLRLNGPSQPEPLVQTPADERNAEISPDGRWLAYESSTTRRSQIYVRPFPNVGDGEYQVSTDGGRTPVWAPNGRELYFTNDSSLMSAAIQTTPAFRAGNPERLFEDRSLLLDARTFTIGGHRTYDVAKDGRFLVMKFSAPDGRRAAEPSVVVVQNWVEELKRLLPAP